MPVTGGLPQGFIQGARAFNIFVNDMDDGTEWTLMKFAGDTKPRGVTEGTDVLPFRGTSTGWRKGMTSTS